MHLQYEHDLSALKTIVELIRLTTSCVWKKVLSQGKGVVDTVQVHCCVIVLMSR